MSVWEAFLARRRKGKAVMEILRENGIRTDREACLADLLDLMQKRRRMHTKTDRLLFQDLGDQLMEAWQGTCWIIQAGGDVYTGPSPARALQRLVLDLTVKHPSRIGRCMESPCPYNGKRLFTDAVPSLAGPWEGARIEAGMSAGDAFCFAEWLCRACKMHATMSVEMRAGTKLDSEEGAPAQLCMPGLEDPAGHPGVELPEEQAEDMPEGRTVLSNAVQLGIPLFEQDAETASWIEVPIDARETEETDTVSAEELAGLFGGEEEPQPAFDSAPVQGEQLSWLDQL